MQHVDLSGNIRSACAQRTIAKYADFLDLASSLFFHGTFGTSRPGSINVS